MDEAGAWLMAVGLLSLHQGACPSGAGAEGDRQSFQLGTYLESKAHIDDFIHLHLHHNPLKRVLPALPFTNQDPEDQRD